MLVRDSLPNPRFLWYKNGLTAKSAVIQGFSGRSRDRLTRKLTKARNARLTTVLLNVD